MKRIIFFFLCTLISAGCIKEGFVAFLDAPARISVGSSASRQSVTITAGAEWHAMSYYNWLKVSPSSGSAGEHTLKVVIDENKQNKVRNANITITSEGLTHNIVVIQDGSLSADKPDDDNDNEDQTPVVVTLANVEAIKGGDGEIILVATWEEEFNDKVIRVTYELRDDSWNLVASGDMAVFADMAEATVTGLTPGFGPYRAVIKPYAGTTAGEQYTTPEGAGYYAGGVYAGTKTLSWFGPEYSQGDRKVKINAGWDSNLFTIDFIGYQIWTLDWSKSAEGVFTDFDVEAGCASVVITLPDGFENGNYILGLYLNETDPWNWCAGMGSYDGTDPLFKNEYLFFPEL